MQVIYNGKDISASIEVKSAIACDMAGGKSDSLDIAVADTEGLWSKWKPQHNDTLELIDGNYKTGMMYVDGRGQTNGLFVLKAKATPQKAKSNGTRAWEKVRFSQVASDLAAAAGLQYSGYEITDWMYDRIDQMDETPLGCLKRLCTREGYFLKAVGGKAIVYSGKQFDAKSPVKTVYKSDFLGEFSFCDNAETKSACVVRYGGVSFRFAPHGATGGELKITTERVASIAEAERFAQGYLRDANKDSVIGMFTIESSPNIAAGNTIQVADVGMFDGKYFISTCKRDLIAGNMQLSVRGVLEGY